MNGKVLQPHSQTENILHYLVCSRYNRRFQDGLHLAVGILILHYCNMVISDDKTTVVRRQVWNIHNLWQIPACEAAHLHFLIHYLCGTETMEKNGTGLFFTLSCKTFPLFKTMMFCVVCVQMIARGKNASDLFPAVVKNVACKNIEVCNVFYTIYLCRFTIVVLVRTIL